MSFTLVEFTRLTPDELKQKGAGLKSVVLDDECRNFNTLSLWERAGGALP